MAPFSGQPAVIVVQPSNHRSYVESAIDRIEDVGSTGHSRAMWDDGAFHDRSEKLGAFFEAKGFKTTANGIKEDVACGFILSKVVSMAGPLGNLIRVFTYSEIGVNLIIVDVAGHVLDLWVEFPDAGHCGGVGF